MVKEVLAESGCVTQRERKLNLELTVWTLIGMYVYRQCGLERALQKLVQGMRLVCGESQENLPGRSGLIYRRQQVGVRVMATLCRRVCRPLATPSTPGAFRFGLRLMALDGTVDAVADTLANVVAFGRAKGSHGQSAYPQVRGVHLAECGTHAIVDSTFWPYFIGERRGATRLLRSVMPQS